MNNRSKVLALALLVAVFAAGAVVGGAASAAWGDRWAGRPPGGERGGLPRGMERELNLTPQQRDSVRAVFERYRPSLHAAWQEVRPRFDTIFGAIDSQVSLMLTPEQRVKYSELIERRKRGRFGPDSGGRRGH